MALAVAKGAEKAGDLEVTVKRADLRGVLVENKQGTVLFLGENY